MNQESINIKISHVNGSGSISTHKLLAHCLFQLGYGLKVNNLFPSNIKGMPTWYQIKASIKAKPIFDPQYDILIAINKKTLIQDLKFLKPSGCLIYDDCVDLPKEAHNHPSAKLPLPINKIGLEQAYPKRLLVQNFIYLGFLMKLMGLKLQKLKTLIRKHHPHHYALNLDALNAGYKQSIRTQSFKLKPPQKKKSRTLFLSGNECCALGSFLAQAQVCAWYPITPATSLTEEFIRLNQAMQNDVQHEARILQMEDETASLGCVLGATFMGARAFTATSGPGISLMTELLGYAYYAEIPAVIFNVQRAGPSTGLPTKSQQADLIQCAYASHGDTRFILLIPSDLEEMLYFSRQAFDLSEALQTPILLLSDLDMAMNEAIIQEPSSQFFKQANDRGPLHLKNSGKPYYRYSPVNSSKVAKRSLPGVCEEGAYIARGSGHDQWGKYTEDPNLYRQNVDRLEKKILQSTKLLPKPWWKKSRYKKPARTLIICCGSSKETLLALQQDTHFDLLVIRSFPFPTQLKQKLEQYTKLIFVEQNQQSQLRKLINAELTPKSHQHSLCYFDGNPISLARLKSDFQRMS